ncbi:MAG: response regulator transcription factor [Sphingobacteriales bacterium]|nr:MAG: response regulator transcription factor [Sphingobacteriales bacterium]
MLTCYIIDDEEFSIEDAKRDIQNMPNLKLIGYNANPLLALKEIHESRPDIVFLDVEMPQLSGIDVAKQLSQTIAIIIRTAHVRHAQNAFDIDAVDFLFKPYRFERFVKAVRKAEQFLMNSPLNRQKAIPKTIFVNSIVKGKVNQITVSEIIYIEAVDHVISIHTQKETFTSRMSLKDCEEKLPMVSFTRVHRAFIVNIDLITSFNGDTVTMTNNFVVSFGELYKQLFKDKIKSRILNRAENF